MASTVSAAPLSSNQMFGESQAEFVAASGLPGGDLILMIANIIRMFLGFTGVIAVIFIVYAGFLWVTAGGVEEKIKKAQKVLKGAFIGLLLILTSFSIAQFVISRITEAMGGAAGSAFTTDGSGGGDVYPDTSRYFYLQSLNTDCAEAIRNFQPQFVFSQNVRTTDITTLGTITIRKTGGDVVPGVFAALDGAASSKTFVFYPDQTCTSGEQTVSCFDASTAYSVSVSSALESATGYSLQCSTSYPCTFSFVTGTGLDLEDPTITVEDPDDGERAYSGYFENLQAHGVDDSGVSSVAFYVDGELLETVGLSGSTYGALALDNYFNSEWDTSGYSTGRDYTIRAVGLDCGGNTDRDEVEVTLLPASCYGTCGSAECGACAGSSCTEDSECASGSCVDGVCEEDVEIEDISPGDGAVGNLITISGSGFGDSAGSVVFLGDPESDNDNVSTTAYTACSGTWSSSQVVVQVPSGAIDGPIRLVTSEGEYDDTDDDNGPHIDDFDVNSTSRPGLCPLIPASGLAGSSTSARGTNFGSTRGDSTLYFGSYVATAYSDWTEVSFGATTPLLSAGHYNSQLFVGTGDARQGSNQVSFTVLSSSSGEPPEISYVDSGIKTCVGTDTICAVDDDCCAEGEECDEGVCEDRGDAGPVGQYVTIYGSGFGTRPGRVYFTEQASEYSVLGDTSFPDECEGVYWNDESITVKVPLSFSTGSALTVGAYDLTVEEAQSGLSSEAVDFEVLNGTALPGICAVEPSGGPESTLVTFYGEHFGSAGTVTFHSGKSSTASSWTSGQITNTAVPIDAQTGPVFVTNAAGQESNSVNFIVGICDEDFYCAAGHECCASGQCSVGDVCEASGISHYAYKFSTGEIPEAPEVLIECSDDHISPTPWEGWSGGTKACTDAVIRAEFTEEMDEASFVASGFSVVKCSDSKCQSTTPVTMGAVPLETTEDGFSWAPVDSDGLATGWQASSTYQVTVFGGSRGVFKSSQGLTLLEDQSWNFTTASSSEGCEIGSVQVSPSETTATEKETPVTFSALPVSKDHQCEVLNCQRYTWGFSSSSSSKASVGAVDRCSVPVTPHEETGSSGPVVITGSTTAHSKIFSDYGLLTIAFTNPKIEAYWPACGEACLNVQIGATFNIPMSPASFIGFDSLGHNKVALFLCDDPACAEDELTRVSLVSSASDYDSATYTVTKTPAAILLPNRYYRVVLSGEIESTSGSYLNEEPGSFAWGNDLSWIFKTKDATCEVDRVEVDPEETVVYHVGAVERFTATPYGEPDDCSATGQPLASTEADWAAWLAIDDYDELDIARLWQDGSVYLSSDLPEGCSELCLNEGSTTPIAVCGDGVVGYGEDCDSGVRCSSNCLNLGTSVCASSSESGCCGNRHIDPGEECDPGTPSDSDSCSDSCLNEGSKALGTSCGDGLVAQSRLVGGEDCDYGSDNSEYNCSSNCLNLGSELAGTAICGNGIIEIGEDCDDRNTTNGDGCSSVCLREGRNGSYGTCGNFRTEQGTYYQGEDCDGEEGCSADCLWLGSGDDYTIPSICGDGDQGIGEECDSSDASVAAPFALAIVTSEAPQAVSEGEDGEASSTIRATDSGSSQVGEGALTLQCSCETDANCDSTGVVYGCGDANCCFERPASLHSYNPQNESGVCRNAAVWMMFNKVMDIEDIENESLITLELVYPDGTTLSERDCSSAYSSAPTTTFRDGESGSFLVRAWRWLSKYFFSIVGVLAEEDEASPYEGCFVDVKYELTQVGSNSKVTLLYDDALLANAYYKFTAHGENESGHNPLDGVLEGASSFGVGMLDPEIVFFQTGEEICTLDIVSVQDEGNIESITDEFTDPSIGIFTESEEQHTLSASAYTRHGAVYEEISPTSVYTWTWSWTSTKTDGGDDDVISIDEESETSITTATAVGLEGTETTVATAIIEDASSSSNPSRVSGSTLLTATLCENYWPNPEAYGAFPFADTEANETAFGLSSSKSHSNFSFYYCRDQQTGGDLLPELTVVEAPVSPSTIFKEVLFLVGGTSDAIGVRVLPNEDYLSPAAWYEEQGFTGSPSETTIDGYEAVQDGNTYYVSAANYAQTGEILYPNIYVISFNENADSDTEEIMDRILTSWSFNAETDRNGDLLVSDLNLCALGSSYTQVEDEYISCDTDAECWVALSNTAAFCDSAKGKMRRDLKRLTDVREIATIISNYGDSHKHCSVTKDQECVSDVSCPGTETCLPEVPDIQSGTFLSAFTTSTWPSWSAELGNELETALPVDPVNEFYNCSEGYDSDYCWNSLTGTFECNYGSQAYIYQSLGGEGYTMVTQLEGVIGDVWAYDLDTDLTDRFALYAEYANDEDPDGFLDSVGEICDGSAIGDSSRCGDGVQGPGEVCEIGDVRTATCPTTGGDLINIACIQDINDADGDGNSDECRYQTASEAVAAGAECSAYECGNGVVEAAAGETCDDGSLNGRYGYCDSNCGLSGAFYCGDGYLAGGEECDCGDDEDIFDIVTSWAHINNCDVVNGAYAAYGEIGCAFDCTYPGPSCGDGEVNGAEDCDGDRESWSGKLCSDGETCAIDSDCSSGTCGTGAAACGTDADGYQLTRYRTCQTSCVWDLTPADGGLAGGWGSCLSSDQTCGNGVVDGDEECDDGNEDNTDSCTNECLNNVCGDGYVYYGAETCDEGVDNGVVCSSDYEDTCAYCSSSCHYTTVSGSYCGNGVVDTGSDEYCDDLDLPKYCFKGASDPSERDRGESCLNDSTCPSGYTCENVGVCNGGSMASTTEQDYLYNGAFCAQDGSSTYNAVCGLTDTDPAVDTEAGTCAAPVCFADCSGSCPEDYQTSSILIKEALAGASERSSADLYSYMSGSDPDEGTLYLPACDVGTVITADIDMSNVEPPTMDIVFVTDLSGSMSYYVDGTHGAPSGQRRIDYAVDSMEQAVEDLFDAYRGSSENIRIASISYSAGTDAADGADVEPCDTGTGKSHSWVDVPFTSSQSDFYSAFDGYLDRVDGGTPTPEGLECARGLLASSSADYKFVILMSDGEPNYLINGSYDSGITVPAQDACEVVHGTASSYIEQLTGAKVYTAAITTSNNMIGYMRHFSSDECSGSCSSDLTDAGDCEAADSGEYAYVASTAEELDEMYQSIIDNILGISVTMISQIGSTTYRTMGSVQEGEDVVLPFPEGFQCDTQDEWVIPMRLSFPGTGKANISDIKLTYCPAGSTASSTTTITDLDSDDDGVNDDVDNCPDDYNPDQEDADSDGLGDACDSYYHVAACGDGVLDEDEVCDTPFSPIYCIKPDVNPDLRDVHETDCATASSCDCSVYGSDYEAVYGSTEAGVCVGGSKIHQMSPLSLYDYDGAACLQGDSSVEWSCGLDADPISSAGICQSISCFSGCMETSLSHLVLDGDNDGVDDVDDNCPFADNEDQLDTDGDGQGDVCDEDDDGDGQLDSVDPCPLDPTDSCTPATTCDPSVCVLPSINPSTRQVQYPTVLPCDCAEFGSSYILEALSDLGYCEGGTTVRSSGPRSTISYSYDGSPCSVSGVIPLLNCGLTSPGTCSRPSF